MKSLLLLLPTLSLISAPVALGAIVITEINYNGPEDGSLGDTDEFLEITNTGLSAVDLSDYAFVGGNGPDFAQDGIGYEFVTNTSIAPGESILVARDVGSLTAEDASGKTSSRPDDNVIFSIPPTTQIFEWTAGDLANGGDNILLVDGNMNEVASFRYFDGGSWPSGPDGNGPTAEIIDPFATDLYDGSNWRASSNDGGSPGSVTAVPEPSSALLLSLGIVATLGRRKRG